MTGTGLKTICIGACLVALGLSACGRDPVARDLIQSGMEEGKPPGSDKIPAGVSVPYVVPQEDGTVEGAAAVNACFDRKAAGMPGAFCPRRAPVIYGGVTYCIGNNG